MPEKIVFKASPRTIMGKKVKLLRKQASLPANLSGDVEKALPIVVDRIAFEKLYHKVGDTGLFYLQIEGEKTDRPVLVGEVQQDPMSLTAVHVVFRQVNLSEKVEAEVPVELTGEFEVKNALVVTVHDAITVRALPQDLPEKFIVDISKLTEVGQQVTFKDLDYDRSKVELDVEEEQLDTPVVLVQEVKEEVVEETPVAEGAEGAAAPAEGGEAAAADAKAEAPTEEKKD